MGEDWVRTTYRRDRFAVELRVGVTQLVRLGGEHHRSPVNPQAMFFKSNMPKPHALVGLSTPRNLHVMNRRKKQG